MVKSISYMCIATRMTRVGIDLLCQYIYIIFQLNFALLFLFFLKFLHAALLFVIFLLINN